MRSALELLDSKKFSALADKFAELWVKDKSKGEAKENGIARALQDLLDHATGHNTYFDSKLTLEDIVEAPKGHVESMFPKEKRFSPKNKGGRPKGSKNKPKPTQPAPNAALKEIDKALTPGEKKRLKAEDEKNKPVPQEEIISRAVQEVIKPNFAAAPDQGGFKCFNVKSVRHGQTVPMSAEKWKQALKAHGINVMQLQFRLLNLGENGDSGQTGGFQIQIA